MKYYPIVILLNWNKIFQGLLDRYLHNIINSFFFFNFSFHIVCFLKFTAIFPVGFGKIGMSHCLTERLLCNKYRINVYIFEKVNTINTYLFPFVIVLLGILSTYVVDISHDFKTFTTVSRALLPFNCIFTCLNSPGMYQH